MRFTLGLLASIILVLTSLALHANVSSMSPSSLILSSAELARAKATALPVETRRANLRTRRAARSPTPTPIGTPTPLPTRTPSVQEQYPALYAHYAEFEEQLRERLYRQALFDFFAKHTPGEFPPKDEGIVLNEAPQVYAHWVMVPAARAEDWHVVIVSMPSAVTIHQTLLFNYRNGKWDWQELPYSDLLQVRQGYYLQRTPDPELLLVYEDCAFCSATAVYADLWQWHDNAWSRVWKMPYSGEARLHGELHFPDPTFKTFQRRYSSWNDIDPKNFFHESNAGPHRYFVETWEREQSGYRLVKTETEPSAYNTLVEFSFAMNHHLWEDARRWAVDDSVVAQARTLGYENVGGLIQPTKGYKLPANDPCRREIEQCDLWNVSHYGDGMGRRDFTVRLVQKGTDWLIAQIEPRRKQ